MNRIFLNLNENAMMGNVHHEIYTHHCFEVLDCLQKRRTFSIPVYFFAITRTIVNRFRRTFFCWQGFTCVTASLILKKMSTFRGVKLGDESEA